MRANQLRFTRQNHVHCIWIHTADDSSIEFRFPSHVQYPFCTVPQGRGRFRAFNPLYANDELRRLCVSYVNNGLLPSRDCLADGRSQLTTQTNTPVGFLSPAVMLRGSEFSIP